MRFFSPLLILATLLAAACGGAAVFPEVFSQERADGKIPVSIELIKKQARKEIDGMPEKQATAERWRNIEADYNDCRLSSARQTKAEADKVFADCMSRKGYVYMLRLDAEQLHDEIAAEEPAKYAAEKKAKEEARKVAEKKRIAAERKREKKRIADEKESQKKQDKVLLGLYAQMGHMPKVKQFLADGVGIDSSGSKGATPLMWAIFGGQPKMAKFLLDSGANPNASDNSDITALMFASSLGYADIARMLLERGANPNWATFIKGETALNLAANKGQTEVAKVLLECGANPDKRNRQGINAWDWAKTQPTMRAIFLRHFEEVKAGKVIKPCVLDKFAVASELQSKKVAESVFERSWQSIVVIRQGENQGSGVIVRPNVVATNCHVVEGGDIVVYKHDNRRATTDTLFNATIRKRDNDKDFCLLDVPGLQGKFAKVRRYDTLKIGEDVYAVGSPKGLDLSLSSGIISQLRQGTNTRYIQTDAAISPGSSGGGLFDSDGNFIGILTRKIADEEVEGIGFAIPADLADNL